MDPKPVISRYSPSTVLPFPEGATVVLTYRTNLSDELDITIGETIHVVSEFADGWVMCVNGRGVQGLVPLVCLDRSRENPAEHNENTGPQSSTTNHGAGAIRPPKPLGARPPSAYLQQNPYLFDKHYPRSRAGTSTPSTTLPQASTASLKLQGQGYIAHDPFRSSAKRTNEGAPSVTSFDDVEVNGPSQWSLYPHGRKAPGPYVSSLRSYRTYVKPQSTRDYSQESLGTSNTYSSLPAYVHDISGSPTYPSERPSQLVPPRSSSSSIVRPVSLAHGRNTPVNINIQRASYGLVDDGDSPLSTIPEGTEHSTNPPSGRPLLLVVNQGNPHGSHDSLSLLNTSPVHVQDTPATPIRSNHGSEFVTNDSNPELAQPTDQDTADIQSVHLQLIADQESVVGFSNASIVVPRPSFVGRLETLFGRRRASSGGSSDTTSNVGRRIYQICLRDVPKQVYNHLLLRLPSLYFSRVSRIFEEADLSLGEIKKMALESGSNDKAICLDGFLLESQNVPHAYLNLKRTWEHFIDSVMREWKTFNIISVLLLSAILTIFQIEAAAEDALTRYTALSALVCALMSLLYGCMYIIRFGTMRKPYKAAEWALEAQKSRTFIFWNVWVLLAMPAVWLSWSLVLYICCIMSFLWRTTTGDAQHVIPLSTECLLLVRVLITFVLALGLLYGSLVIATFRRYGEVMDTAWKKRINGWIELQAEYQIAALAESVREGSVRQQEATSFYAPSQRYHNPSLTVPQRPRPSSPFDARITPFNVSSYPSQYVPEYVDSRVQPRVLPSVPRDTKESTRAGFFSVDRWQDTDFNWGVGDDARLYRGYYQFSGGGRDDRATRGLPTRGSTPSLNNNSLVSLQPPSYDSVAFRSASRSAPTPPPSAPPLNMNVQATSSSTQGGSNDIAESRVMESHRPTSRERIEGEGEGKRSSLATFYEFSEPEVRDSDSDFGFSESYTNLYQKVLGGYPLVEEGNSQGEGQGEGEAGPSSEPRQRSLTPMPTSSTNAVPPGRYPLVEEGGREARGEGKAGPSSEPRARALTPIPTSSASGVPRERKAPLQDILGRRLRLSRPLPPVPHSASSSSPERHGDGELWPPEKRNSWPA